MQAGAGGEEPLTLEMPRFVMDWNFLGSILSAGWVMTPMFFLHALGFS